MAETVQLSQAAFDRLKTEHDDLTTRGRVDIARKIEAARELGDLSENGDYHAAKEEQGKMEGRIIHLNRIIMNAEIVEEGGGSDSVQAGTVITIRYDDDEPEQYLFGSIEERREGLEVMSPGSPLGELLAGKAEGDVVDFTTPSGHTMKVTVVAIDT